VRIVLPSLEPLPLRGTWARLFDHTHSFELGNFFVQEFAVTSQSRELLHIWADEPGIPLRLERSEQGSPCAVSVCAIGSFGIREPRSARQE
jgi:hypothetical protein